MKPIFFVAFTLILLSVSYATDWEATDINGIYKYTDEFEGYTVLATDNTYLTPETYFGKWQMEIRQVKTSESAIYYWLNIFYDGSEWFFIDEGNSFVCVADSEKIILSVKASGIERNLNTSGSGAYVYESASYTVTPNQIKKIANAKDVKFRIYGDDFKHNLDGKFSKENLQMIQIFYKAIVEGKWQEALMELQEK
jgi:hypothetical protein